MHDFLSLPDGKGFEPEDVSDETMEKIRKSLETYLEVFTGIMVIPDDLQEKHGKRMKDGIAVARDVVKMLKKGKRSIFISE